MFLGRQLNSWHETWALKSQLLLTVMESVSPADPFLKKGLGMVSKGGGRCFPSHNRRYGGVTTGVATAQRQRLGVIKQEHRHLKKERISNN